MSGTRFWTKDVCTFDLRKTKAQDIIQWLIDRNSEQMELDCIRMVFDMYMESLGSIGFWSRTRNRAAKVARHYYQSNRAAWKEALKDVAETVPREEYDMFYDFLKEKGLL